MSWQSRILIHSLKVIEKKKDSNAVDVIAIQAENFEEEERDLLWRILSHRCSNVRTIKIWKLCTDAAIHGPEAYQAMVRGDSSEKVSVAVSLF